MRRAVDKISNGVLMRGIKLLPKSGSAVTSTLRRTLSQALIGLEPTAVPVDGEAVPPAGS